jgi:MFS family permease
MRRLLVLVMAVVCAETMLATALTPLLPHYVDELGLSKSVAGLIVAAYGLGVLVGSVPGGAAAARFGAKPAVLVGLALLALASLAFGAADGTVTLFLARFAQGLGASLSWAGALAWLVMGTPRTRRGEMLGTAIGAAVVGALLGPVVGAAAASVGALTAFAGISVLYLALLAWAARTPPEQAEQQSLRAVPAALRDRRLQVGLWLMTVPALLFGILSVLVPLRLHDAGWGAVAIGAVFVGAAAFETFVGPVVGRISDRRGRLVPLRFALGSSIVVSAAFAFAPRAWTVAALVFAAAVAYGAFYAPSLALLSDGAEHAGLAQALAFGLMNAAWALGNATGPSLGGALADHVGDAWTYLVGSAVCAVTLSLLTMRAVPGTAAAHARLRDR